MLTHICRHAQQTTDAELPAAYDGMVIDL